LLESDRSRKWAVKTKADFAEVMIDLKAAKKEAKLYEELLTAAETTADANDLNIARLDLEVGELKELLKTEQDKRNTAETEICAPGLELARASVGGETRATSLTNQAHKNHLQTPMIEA